MPYTTISEVWSYYDRLECQGFDAHDISCAIAQVPADGPDKTQRHYELFAFGFYTGRKNDWGTFYYYFNRPLTDITPEILSYWEQRATSVVNPLLKTRYTGLVLEFKKRVTGQNPDYKSIKIAHVEAIIDVVNGDYCKRELDTLAYVAHALKLANSFKNDNLRTSVVKAFYEAHKRMAAEDSHAGLWSKMVQSLIRYRKAFADYEGAIIQENIERLNRLEALALKEGGTTDSHAHTMAQQVEILCLYYHSIGEDDKIEELLDRLLEAMRAAIPARGGIWGQSMLERMQARYRKYGYDKKANRLYVDISKMGRMTIEEMKPMEIPFTVKKEWIDRLLEESLEGSLDEVMERYILNHIPIKEHEIKRQQKNAEQAPLLAMVTTMIIDEDGIPLNRIGGGKNTEEQKLHHSIYEGLSISAFFMQIVMQEIIDKKNLTVDAMMDMFKDCPLANDDIRALLERGFEAYLAGDDIACCHILVPQFEAMIRYLVLIRGGEVLRTAKDPVEGNEYFSLGSLLDSPAAKELLPEDVLLYFKVLFVSQAGWNIRNNLSHGLFRAKSFSRAMSDRVVHALLVLSLIKTKDIE